MFILACILYVLIGSVAGFTAGLLGIGGGLIAVPGILLVFHLLDVPIEHSMQIAVGTSLAAMVFTSASSAYAHYRLKGIYWSVFFTLIPGVVLGAILGAIIADYLPSKQLAMIFGMLACVIGIYFLFPTAEEAIENVQYDSNVFLLSLIGFFIGIVSSIMGIGGGIVTVPILLGRGVPLRNAISTSAAVGFAIAVAGAASFLLLGLKQQTLNDTLGYIYVPASIMIGVTAVLAAPFGAKMAYKLPTEILRRVFGIYLLLVGIAMFFKVD